ncbi:WXG100 family type VII secretion target [Nocardia sp. NPDC050175]|uniref:WXG100 family type VII secretion target n=1 Tax=Nocardia sp. NPDC050175 TaxID=3364317 RepID=UPI0037A22E63
MTIVYDPTEMNHLRDELQNNGGKMKAEIDSLEDAAKGFHDNLTGESAKTGFDQAHKALQSDLSDTLKKLDDLATQVENALHRAIEADGKVGDGFAAF